MSIISIKFIIFVLGLLFLYYIFPKKIRWIILLLGSLIFYYLSCGKLIVFILLSIISIFFIGLALNNINEKISLLDKNNKEKKEKYVKRKKSILVFGIILNILFIVFTKYFNFTISNINWLLNLFHIKSISKSVNLLLPLGISYYTLEAISYIVDVYRGKYSASKNIFKVALFLLYFPKIVEGPFCRFNELSKEIYENNKLDFNNLLIGLDLIVFGLFKKMVIADRAAIYVNNIFGSNYGGLTVIVAIVLYTIQIYTEFSGCIDIVRGVSLLFGVRLPINFRNPFYSKDIQEFWRRWHISLGAWIKEYVFYSISFSKLNFKVIKFAKNNLSDYLYKFISAAFPLLFVWLVNGIWHGASYKYIVYGLYYYVFMMIGLLLAPISKKISARVNKKVLDTVHIIRTIILVMIGMTLFRASTLNEFGSLFISIFKSGSGIFEFGLTTIDFIILGVSFSLVLLVDFMQEFNKVDMENGFTKSVVIRSLIYTFLICTIVIFGIYGDGYDVSNFIYGAF